MPGYPVHILLTDQPCVVVGGGAVAFRKVAGLVAGRGRVSVVAPKLCDELAALVDSGEVKWVEKRYEGGDLDGAFLAITATDDPSVNRRVFEDGEEAGVMVNSADDPENCRFILPSVVRRDDLVISISTGGRSPAMASVLRKRLSDEYGDEWGLLTKLLGEARAEIRATGKSTEGMADRWEAAISDDVLASIRAGDIEAAKRKINEWLL